VIDAGSGYLKKAPLGAFFLATHLAKGLNKKFEKNVNFF
jgi:hypothetical protein